MTEPTTVKCCYTAAPSDHPKIWLTYGDVRYLVTPSQLENFIHYGLDAVQDDGWAKPFRSDGDHMPEGPGVLPLPLRRDPHEVVGHLYRRGLTVSRHEAIRRCSSVATFREWRRTVVQRGDWQLSDEGRMLLRAAKVWLQEQPVFADSGAVACFSLSEDVIHQAQVDQLTALCGAWGFNAEVIANRVLPKGASGIAGPHLLVSHEAHPTTYWLKQEVRAEDQLLGAVWDLLEAQPPTSPDKAPAHE